jgi:hypothetical protein
MRFVSKIRKYQICFQRDIIEHFATGESRVIQPLLNCEFDLFGSMRPYEIAAAREAFINRGLPLEADGITTIDPLYRFSVFDTEEFQKHHRLTDEKRVELEQFLLNNFAYGTYYIMVEEPRVPAPWPTYDTVRGVKGSPTALRIAEKVREDGFPVEDVIAYERQNQNRQDVIDALEALKVEEAVEDESVVLA